MDDDWYIQMLQQTLLPFLRAVMQHNALMHTSTKKGRHSLKQSPSTG